MKKISKVNYKFTTEEKLKIFNDYFKGRTDIFATRWENNDKKGYTPTVNEQYKYYRSAERKQISNKELYKRYTNDDLFSHLKGDIVIGIYPLLPNNKTRLLAFDFDDDEYEKDSFNLIKELKANEIDYLIERSRSGNGIHIWLFFENEQKASEVRSIGRYLLSQAMKNNFTVNFKSFDRMFPSQDYLSKSEFGNLIALPLNGTSGLKKNTLFLDDNYQVIDEQYQKLKKTRKISDEHFNKLLVTVNLNDELITLNEKLEEETLHLENKGLVNIEILGQLIFRKNELTSSVISFLKRLASVSNPEYFKKQRMRINTYNTSSVIQVFKEDKNNLYVPKGLLSIIIEQFNINNIDYKITDNLLDNFMNDEINFIGSLYPYQLEAVNDVQNYTNGIIHAPTGSGKTVMAIYLAILYKKRTLIIVNSIQLAKQWEKRIKNLLMLLI